MRYIYYSGNGIYPDVVLDYFDNEELTQQVLFEIIGLISLKAISNYVNNYLTSVKSMVKQSLSNRFEPGTRHSLDRDSVDRIT